MRKQLFASIGVAAVIGVGAYWYWSPYIALHDMREAARAADADEFNAHVDYPKVRESLKGQLSAMMTRELMTQPGGGSGLEKAGAAFGSMLGLALVDRMVDGFVRPETVMQAMQNGKFKRASSPGGETDQQIEAAKIDVRLVGQALKLYKLDHGTYPTQEQGLKILVEPEGKPNVGRTYLDTLPLDPWGRPYQYRNPGVTPGEVDVTYLLPPARATNTARPDAQDWHTVRKGTDRIIVYAGRADDAGAKEQAGFVMMREGFAQWKLTEIRMPVSKE